ncbi:class I SAM-dependent methyltransferase [Bauldia sp.]|uniref:class I SAM-dependent methyltransferase n=1 Tax=Bauldia sp. TaxID=2575872 RepID=UPI003BACE259
MTGYVGAEHAFHDSDFAQDWADRFAPSGPRLQLFDLILSQVERLDKPTAHVVELGTGPGYLARHILERNNSITYEAVDFSDAFLDVARKTLGDHGARVVFTNADLMDLEWPARLSKRPDAVVSTWALHDLGGQQAVADVYARCLEALPEGGVLVNGDFIKPDGTTWDFEAGRFPVARHLELLHEAGFKDAECLALLEPNIETPTSAQNYACLVATR